MSKCIGHIKMFFIRHAFSCANYHKRNRSIIKHHIFIHDPILSNIGEEDLIRYKPIIRKVIPNPTYVLSSNLLRAMQTARILFPKRKIIVCPYIGENGFGLDNKPSKPSNQLKYVSNVDYRYLGGDEQTSDLDRLFKNRKKEYDKPDFGKFIEWFDRVVLNGEVKDINIVVVGHSNFMRKFMIDEKMAEKKIKGKPRNAGVIEINLCRGENGKISVYKEGCPPIKSFEKESVIDNYPCYGVRLIGVEEPNIKERKVNC